MQGFYETLVICCNWAGWVHILSPARYPIGIKNGLYIYIYIHMYLIVYHVYMYKASPLHIGTRAVIILCAWILWNSPKFSIKIMLYRHVNTDTNMYVHVCMYNHAYIYIHIRFLSYACMYVMHMIYSHIYIYVIFLYANTVLFLR